MICHAIVWTFILGSSQLLGKDLQFLDYCPSPMPIVCQMKFTTEQGVSSPVKQYVWCADRDKKTVYKGNVAEMIEA